MPLSLRFDRGTLVIDGARAPSLAGVVWDPRTQNHRASAHRYASLRAAALASGDTLHDPLRERWKTRIQGWLPIDLRPYQRDALTAWVGDVGSRWRTGVAGGDGGEAFLRPFHS